MKNVHAVLDAIRRIDAVVREDFHGTAVPTTPLVRQAEQIAASNFEIETLLHPATYAPMDRSTAARIIEAMAHLPPLDWSESKAFTRAYALLLGNLTTIVTSSIYRLYPDVVPRRR